jgi:hypothetical protein
VFFPRIEAPKKDVFLKKLQFVKIFPPDDSFRSPIAFIEIEGENAASDFLINGEAKR